VDQPQAAGAHFHRGGPVAGVQSGHSSIVAGLLLRSDVDSLRLCGYGPGAPSRPYTSISGGTVAQLQAAGAHFYRGGPVAGVQASGPLLLRSGPVAQVQPSNP